MIEHDHHFKPSEAKRYGLTEAVILYNIRFWLDKNRASGSHVYDGRVWTYNSYKAFSELFDYLSESQIKRAITKLQDAGVLVTGNYNKMPMDKTKWYSIDDAKYVVDSRPIQKTKRSNEQTISSAPSDDFVQAIPDINTDSKQQIINTYTREKGIVPALDHFVKLWNYTYGTNVKPTDDKHRQVKARLKIYTPEEIQLAIQNRSRDPWFQGEGAKFYGDWESFWRNDSKIERYLNRRPEVVHDQPGDLPF